MTIITWILIAAAVALFILAAIFFINKKRRLNAVMGIIAALLMASALGLCAFGASAGPLYVRTDAEPEEIVQEFFDAVLKQDGETACLQLSGITAVDFFKAGADECTEMLCRVLMDSYSYKITSTEKTGPFAATVNVDFSHTDLKKITEGLSDTYDGRLYEILMSGSYGTELETAYAQTYNEVLSEALEGAENASVTDSLTLSVNYDTSGWKIEADSDLVAALCGGLKPSGLSDRICVADAVETFSDNKAAELRGDESETKTIYTIPESATAGPVPDSSKFKAASVDDLTPVMNAIAYAQACGLLDGQDVIFDPDTIDFYPYSDVEFYCDSTILVICWKEDINDYIVSCCEVKIADGSQLRRKLANDSYGSGQRYFASTLAAETNAVVAMNADFYEFRNVGITVYDRQLYRYQTSCDALFIDSNGKFNFYYPDSSVSREEMEKYLADNDIVFSLAFGPVLIDNYKIRTITETYAYGLGELNQPYSRAAICEYDDQHYFYMHLGFTSQYNPPRCDVNTFAQLLATKNVRNAYNLDGGQTGELIFNNEPYNYVDYGSERLVSDIIYFATAIPEEADE